MELYFAPMEGIGGYLYRNAQADFFARADKYFTPFLSPGSKKRLTPKSIKEVAPEHNRGITLVPQVMTNDARAFAETVAELEQMGYSEVNLNLGCPSKTVVSKGRGAGFLADPDALDRFFDETFSVMETAGAGARISAKTRIGMNDPEEFVRLMEIYNRYPLVELIIHPRLQTDYYRNHPDMEMFSWALEHAAMPVVYNGDIFSLSAFEAFRGSYPAVRKVMIGRGVLADPALFGEIRGEERLTKERLRMFHDRMVEDYKKVLSGEKNVLFKMKELWEYMIHVFPNSVKYGKAIRKAQNMGDYSEAVRRLFADREIQEYSQSGGAGQMWMT